jgi:hypothetical protein
VEYQHSDVGWQIAMMQSKRKTMDKSKPINSLKDMLEKLKPSIRAKYGGFVTCCQVPVCSS